MYDRQQGRKTGNRRKEHMTMQEIEAELGLNNVDWIDNPRRRGELSHQLADGGKNAGLATTLRPIEKRTIGPRGV